MHTKVLAIGILLSLSAGTTYSYAQGNALENIDTAFQSGTYAVADKLLDAQLSRLRKTKRIDSIPYYISLAGKITVETKGIDPAIKRAQSLLSEIKAKTNRPKTLRFAYREAADFFGTIDRNQLAYTTLKEAYKLTISNPDGKPEDIAKIESDLGTYAQRVGDLSLAQTHHRKAIKSYHSAKKQNYESLIVCYINMGGVMWYASKLDSAQLYFEKALQTVNKIKLTPENKYYRRAIVENNLAGVYGLQGKTTVGINALRSCINNIRRFLASKEPSHKKVTAISFQYEAIENLAAVYQELGDLKQAEQLFLYANNGKTRDLDPTHPAIFLSEILLGELYYAQKEYDKATRYLNKALERIPKADGDFNYSQGDAYHTLAKVNSEQEKKKEAAYYFEKADSVYELSLQGNYDDVYLDFLKNSSFFYAKNGDSKKALAKAQKGYNYIVKTHGANTLLGFYQILNLSEVYLLSKNYKEALNYSRKGLAVVNEHIRSSDNLLDSIKIELRKPKGILLKTKAEYALMKKKDVPHLAGLLKELSEALTLLEKRKIVVGDAENMRLLMADHADLLEFAKKLTIELYSSTKNERYADQLISLHESGIYNRIRARLDKTDSLPFAHISAEAQATERKLKANITKALEGDRPNGEKMQSHFAAIEKWNAFKETLRKEHPVYYKMRYGSIFRSSAEVQQSIPERTTVIRYLFIEKELYALVIDAERKQIFKLKSDSLEENIKRLSQYKLSEQDVTDVLHKLYSQLWGPIASGIVNKRVIIIPDGILYSLSFETLTPQKIRSYREFATTSLLAKHSIAYHYSLFLLQPKTQSTGLSEKFVAFAPGFSKELKEEYRHGVKDSMDLDNEYLHLLPQPFTVDLAKKTKSLLGGNLYVNTSSTEKSFKESAGKHEIIHIGTHAESNNLYPEYSKLIFAKNPEKKDEDNSLFLGEIYNCDLTSQLTVLTACETGKPGYQDGEGMISLAHAFNFAGSESILMGLWKIDEKSSSGIVESFYRNLIKGLPKDEALRQAKLKYLTEAKGEALDPAYWAGMVIMGDATAIKLEQTTRKGYWVAGALCLIGMVVFIKRQEDRERKKKDMGSGVKHS